MPIAKHLIVENGLLKVATKPMPMLPPEDGETYDYNATLESWKQEAVPIDSQVYSHSFIVVDLIKSLPYDKENSVFKDGIYDAPVGLEYEAIEEGWKDRCRKSNCDGDGACLETCVESYNKEVKRFAILSFASPKEETSKEINMEESKQMTIEELKAMQLHEKRSIDLYNSVMRVPGGWIYTFTFASSENRDMEVFQNNVFVPEQISQK